MTAVSRADPSPPGKGSELELKFHVPAASADALRAELRRRGARVTPLTAIYFDTADNALARQRVALRIRREGWRWVQALKGKGRSVVDRLEVEIPLRALAGGTPPLAPERFAGTPADEVLKGALAAAASPDLQAVYETDVRRLACTLVLPGATVEAAFDEGAIRAGARHVAVHELELELKSGDVRALCDLAAGWADYGGLWLDARPKSARGTLLARGEPHGPVVKAQRSAVDATMDGPRLLRAVVSNTLDQILPNVSEIAAGVAIEGHIHQARVGLRRLRTALRELGALDPAVDEAWEPVLARAFAQLGVARDAVTAARAARPLLERAHAPKLAWDAADAGDPTAAVLDPAFQRVLIVLLGYAHAAPEAHEVQAALSAAAVRAHVCDRLARLHRHVSHAARDFATQPFDNQHRARKRLKRLRYVAEFVAPLFDAKQVAGYLDHLEPAQDALGAHVDIEVAMEKFRADAAGDTQALFAAGYLEAHLADTGRDAQTALKKVAKAEPFWDR